MSVDMTCISDKFSFGNCACKQHHQKVIFSTVYTLIDTSYPSQEMSDELLQKYLCSVPVYSHGKELHPWAV